MLKKIIKNIIKKKRKRDKQKERQTLLQEREAYLAGGCVPWSKGYHAYKEEYITTSINNRKILDSIKLNSNLENYGYRLDERVIEYPWIFSKLSEKRETILDAGSTFNFPFIVNHPVIENKDLTIFTFAPEKNNFCSKRVSYIYGDLRSLPFKDELFDVVVSQSTIEHIDMDNSIYGYDLSFNKNSNEKSYEYLIAIKEMIRVLKNKGQLLLTFPYGKFENHGFFQQFDEEMLNKIIEVLNTYGSSEVTFFEYRNNGWEFSIQEVLEDIVPYNPHTGKGKLNDGAAHCRSIACLYFIKQ